MNEQEGKKKLIERVVPNRRDFVRRVLGGAFAAPVIVTFSIDALTPTSAEAQISPNTSSCLPDPGYVGPSVFVAHFFDPTKTTRVNGEATFVLTPSGAALQAALTATFQTTINSAHIVVNGNNVANLPPTGGPIQNSNIMNLCNFDELLQALAAGIASISVSVTFNSQTFTLTGPIVPSIVSSIVRLTGTPNNPF